MEIKYINCAKCGKQIEKKVNRLYCIKCRNEIDKELATIRRENNREQLREYSKEYYSKNKKSDGTRNVLYV